MLICATLLLSEVELRPRGVGLFGRLNLNLSSNTIYIYRQTLRTLQQYPSGLTRSILLTETDTKWCAALKRGENAGRLRQVISTSQISSSDILQGDLEIIDEFRYILNNYTFTYTYYYELL